ncbi:MAG TPA: hypothetical protein VM261_27530 [Kofleriaceae bacterium]|nr:hypothetical protein [Kofleriaceae bacterium]
MRVRSLDLLAFLTVALAAAACKIDSTVYQPPADDDDDDGDAAIDDAMPDAPPQGITVLVNPGTTTVTEGGQVTVRIKLSEAPPADRPITVVGNTQLVPTPSTVTFTPSNWMNERTIILAAGQDDDADDSPVTVLFDGMGDVADGSAMVMITDDDAQILVVSPTSSIGVTEGATGQVSVQLAARPSSSVVVSVASMDAAIASVSPATLTFTSGNWNVAQPVTVTGAPDTNTSNDTTLLILDPTIDGIPTHTLAINVTDDDVIAIDANPGNLGTINEGNVSPGVTFNVRLTQMPGANVTVNVTSPSGAIGVSPATLTFTPANFGTNQVVTATAPEDGNVVDESVSIRLAATGLTDRFVQVQVDDNDTQVIQVTPSPSLGITEGATGNFAVLLAFQPADNVIVNVASSDTTVATAGTSQLTFTPSDFGTPQNVVITGVQDVDLASESATISFNAPAQGLTTNRTANVTDDDTQVIDVAPSTISVAEGGSDTFAVALSYQPSGNVTVASMVATANATDIAATPPTLTFTPQNYATAQNVTVMGLQDADVTNESATVNVTSSGLSPRAVTVNVSDDDSLGIVVTPSSLTVTEGGASMNILVSLAAMPASNVTVNLATMPTGVATLGAATLTFTPANYATPQPVSVTGTQDPDGLDGTTTIHLTAAGLDEKTVPVTVRDDDIVSPVLSPNPVTITEGTSNTSVRLTLSRDPGKAITVEILSFGATDFEVQPTTYVFERNDWNIGQTVNLFAYPDDETDNESEDILFSIQSESTSTNLHVDITDPTVLLGFPPPHGTGTGGLAGLEAWRDGQMPACFVVEKIAVDVSTASQFSQLQLGLYTTNANSDTEPDRLLYSSGVMSLGVGGAGRRIIDVPDTTIFELAPLATWLALEATTGVSLKTKSTSSSHCSRVHPFGNFMPNPFNSTGTGTGGMPGLDGGTSFDSGTSSDAGTATVTCNSAPPVAVWIIGHGGGCFVEPT